MVEFVGGPPLPYDPSYHLLWRIDKIRAAVREARPDVLEIHSPYGAAIAGLTFRKRAFARTFFWHSDFIDTYKRVLHVGRALDPLWAWVRQIASACDRTIVASEDQETKLRLHGVRNTVRIPMGVEREVFRPRERTPHEGFLLVGAGRFAVEKRWDVVLDAVRYLRAEGTNVRLVLYGDGPEKLQAGDGVELRNFEKDRNTLARALADADVFVHGCPYETFGVAIAEAVACATPIVVPDQGAAREHVRNAAGRTYEAGDARACARAIRDLLAMDPNERRSAAERAAKDVVSVDEHFTRLLDLYSSLTC